MSRADDRAHKDSVTTESEVMDMADEPNDDTGKTQDEIDAAKKNEEGGGEQGEKKPEPQGD